MRENTVTDEEYEEIKKNSPGRIIEGTIEEYWQPMYCSPTHYSIVKRALKTKEGWCPFDVSLPVGPASGAHLPVGTKIKIEISPGITPPFNRFCEESIKFVLYKDKGVLWLKEHSERPESWDDNYDDDIV